MGEPGDGPALGIRRICSRILSAPIGIPIGLPGGQSSPPSTPTGPQSSHKLGLLGLLAVGFLARFLAFCSRSLDKSTVTVVRKTCGDSGLSGGREGAETARGSGVLTLRDPVAVCGLRGDDTVWAETIMSRGAALRKNLRGGGAKTRTKYCPAAPRCGRHERAVVTLRLRRGEACNRVVCGV